mmetsp:Transcript_8841/g.14343  ORF Transcript_8841/g.14343 Transcript_8841/m.14343 type:complete len:525 (+) Transcript_8841:81-1655(+)
MWGFGSRKKRIDTLEKYIEELQNSIEEAEVTVATKDEIIKNMLNERKSEEQEIERLNEQILVCLNKIQSEENGYQKATAIKISSAAAGGASAGRFLCPSRRKSGVFGFGSLKKRRGGGNNSNNNNCDNHLLGLPSDSEAVAANGSLTGKLGMSCKVYNLRGKNLNLKLRQGGQTLAGGKSEVIAAVKNPRNTAFSRSRKKKMMAAASKMGSSSSSSTFKYVAKFSQVAVKIPDLDRNLPLEIQVWQKGNFRSKSVAGVNVWIKDLVTLFRNNESAIYDMHRASEMDSNLVSKAQLTIAMDDDMLSQEDIKEKGDLLSSTRKRQRSIKVGSSNASSTRTTTASSKGGGKNICLEIEAVRIQPPSRRHSKQMNEESYAAPLEAKSLRGVAMDDLVGRWTSLAGDYNYVTRKGRVLDNYKHEFGQLTIAVKKEEYDVGMINHDEGGAFYFASLKNGRLCWSDDDQWMGRNRAQEIWDNDDDDDATKAATVQAATGDAKLSDRRRSRFGEEQNARITKITRKTDSFYT